MRLIGKPVPTFPDALSLSLSCVLSENRFPLFRTHSKAYSVTVTDQQNRPLDAAPDQWLRRVLPSWALPFAELARFDRPIGAWLLLLPCWFGLGLGALVKINEGQALPATRIAFYAVLFLLGAFIMRGAGCAYNDIIDRDFDAKVARTRGRPLPSGRVTVTAAWIYAIALSWIGFFILIQFNWLTIITGIASLVLVALYPFAKRFTGWPQLILGFVFKWGALVGYTAAVGRIDLLTLVLYAGCVAWTVGYDTIYAHQDARDDPAAGVRSTALTLAGRSHFGIASLFVITWILWFLASRIAGAGVLMATALAAVALHFTWQVATLDTTDPKNCLARFKSNKTVGFLFTVGFLAEIFAKMTQFAP
ncbi:MAG: 4-hydroxybenzoate polyprenyltransferase [Pseudomonadota bacterium]